MVNGKLLCTVPTDSITLERLEVGAVFDGGLRQRAERAADQEAAFRGVLRALERRSFARKDLARRLVRRGHPPEATEAALDRAQRAGLLDDLEYAGRYVETRAQRGRGPSRIARDLLVMGVDRSVIDRALAERWPSELNSRGLAAALAAKRAAQLGDLPEETQRRRILGFLARRGFSGREVRGVVAEAVRRRGQAQDR
jgi:regulatory protein